MIEDGVTGFLIPSGDSKKLAQQISFLLREDKIRKSMGMSAFAFAPSYWSLTNTIKQVSPFYHQTIRKNSMNN